MKQIDLTPRLTKSQGKFILVTICVVTGMMIDGSTIAAQLIINGPALINADAKAKSMAMKTADFLLNQAG